MPAVGPFRIDGEDWETDAAGTISRTRPAIPANTRNPGVERPQAIRRRKQADLAQVNEDITALEAQKTQLETDIANLNTIISNAAGGAGALRT